MKFKSIKTKIVLIFSILIMLVVSTLYFVSDINITNLANERVLDKMDSISKIGYDLQKESAGTPPLLNKVKVGDELRILILNKPYFSSFLATFFV